MDNILCFVINDEHLYLEKTLVDFNSVPIFFVCNQGQQRYLALCTDVDEAKYFVVKTPIQDIHGLLHGNISMRDAMLKQEKFWRIDAGNTPSEDVVVECPISDIDLSVLPAENACFKILTQEITEYVKKIDCEFDSLMYSGESYCKNMVSLETTLELENSSGSVSSCANEHLATDLYNYDKIIELGKKMSVKLLKESQQFTLFLDDLYSNCHYGVM